MMKHWYLIAIFLFITLLSPVEGFTPSASRSRLIHLKRCSSGGWIKKCGTVHLRSSSASSPLKKHEPGIYRCNVPQLSSRNDENNQADSGQQQSISFGAFSKSFCRLSPIWTLLSAAVAIKYSTTVGATLGSLSVMQTALAILMLAMGLTITPADISRAIQKPSIILLNILLCFGMMPMISVAIGNMLKLSPEYNAGLILLGSVSGGQASNLFALLAGGDVALSVACTLSTTLLGTIAIPLLVKCLLNCIVVVDFIGVLKSVAQLVLLPLTLGLSFGKMQPSLVKKLETVCPFVGVLSTLILVAGGASNCAFASIGSNGSEYLTIMLAAYLLPVFGGIASWLVSYLNLQKSAGMEESSRRALVVETLSKSPTLAFVLAKKHFSDKAAAIPAGGMVSLAIVGAVVASMWNSIDPIEGYEGIGNQS